MSGIKDTATVTLNVNGAQAKQMMSELEQKISDTKKKISDLKAKLADPKALEQAKRQLSDYQESLKTLLDKASEAKAAIKKMKEEGAEPKKLAEARTQLKKYSSEIGYLKRAITDTKSVMADFEPKTLEKAKKKLKTYEKQLDEVRSATEGVNSALSNLDSATPRQLEKALRTLNRQLKDMTPGSETWNSHIEKIKELKGRVSELKEETKEQQSLWQKFMGWSQNAWPAIDLLNQWGSGFVDLARSAVDAFAEMDQEMANVRKFTGMTAEQVEELNEEFKKMDTRTSREDLNKLAQEAGRLGKTSSEDILGFVRAADKINVALDDLGDGATLKLSKLTGIFGDEKIYGTEQSLLKVGSVINELSQNCRASAPYLAEFASRMGGVGAQAGMTIQQVMGFGAVLDTYNQKVEASSTALSQVITRMMQEPAKYAKVAGLEVQKFSTMLKEDANGALLMFLESLQKAGGMDVLSPMFKDMGETGSRAIQALSTLATHIDEVKSQQEAANVAFKEGISIDKEFDVQNNTVQAGLEKCKKAAQEIRVELGQKLQPLMSHMLSSTSAIMRALLTTVKFLIEYKGAVISLAAAITAYNIVVNGSAMLTQVWGTVCKVVQGVATTSRVVILALRIGYYELTGQITRATAATRIFNTVSKASPIGIVVSLVTALIGVLATFLIRTDEARKAMERTRKEEEKWKKSLTDLSEASAQACAAEESRLKSLYQTAIDQAKSTDERRRAAEQLQQLYLAYFKNLSTEEILVGKAKNQYDQLRDSIIKAARARAAAAKIEENEGKLMTLEDQLKEERQAQQKRQQEYNKAVEKKKEAEKKHRKDVDGAALGDSREMNSRETQKHVKALDNAADAVRDASGNLKEANNAVSQTEKKIAAINQANKELADKYRVSSSSNKTLENPEIPYAPKAGYTSKVQAEKERKKAEKEKKKAEAAARAAAVKAKKEFKEQLDQIKAARDKEQAEILALRMMGEIDYIEYNKRKLAADEKYYDDSIDLYKKWGIQEDDECQALARKREEFLNKTNEQRLALNKEVIQRIAQAEERDLKARYESKSRHTLAEELRLEEEILKIRFNALMDQQALYLKTDKEYEEYQRQIDDLFLKDQESKQKKILEKINEFRKKFDHQSIHVKYDMERAALEELYERKKIKEEEYRKWLKKLNEQEAQEEKKDKEDLPGMKKPQNHFTNAALAREKYERQKKELDEALSDGRIDESEYRTAMRRIGAELRKSLVSPLQECKSEWVSLMSTMIESWAEFADALKDPDGDPFVAIGNAIEATAAIATSVMSMVTEFQKAEYEIQAAEVKKRYDAEIDAAQGNSYRIRKLEKEREKELANLKSEQSKKQFAMQVLSTVAQTAANAVQAFGAGLTVGGLAGLILAPLAAAMAVAQGTMQIALIKKQQQAAAAQGYSKGGFTKPGAVDEPAGIVHAGEWVASQKLLANPVARPMIEALDYAQRTNTIGSLRDEDVSRSIRASDSMVRIAESDGSSALMVAAVAQNAEVMASLNERLKHPIDAAVSIAGENGIAQAEDKYDRYLKNKSPKKF